MSRQTLVLVESPKKAKLIQGFLGGAYTVRASMGHICDLPRTEYGVDIASFEEQYELNDPARIAALRKLARGFQVVLLATDPDREGEAIAWHLARELRLDPANARRIVFREITPTAIAASIQAPAPIDMKRVDAARSRRVLDRIVGFDVSKEICWPAGAKSAGRVQSPALHILCERERAILAFVPRKYWTLTVDYEEGFTAFVPADPNNAAVDVDPGNEDDDAGDGPERRRARPREFGSEAEADAVRQLAMQHDHVVGDTSTARQRRSPDKPYKTSTLLQDASRKLGLSARKTADLAQMLYEAGYITYMRTDSTRLSADAVDMARQHIAAEHPHALPAKPPSQPAKGGAQDAHEAIRPTRLTNDGAPPAEAADLYRMIKARFLASQCKPAEFDRTTIHITSGPVRWVAEGSVLVEPGFLVYWLPYARQNDEILPKLSAGEHLTPEKYQTPRKQTSPPPRYDTGSLTKKLESSGVGRPSTYPTILDTLLRRGYAQEIKGGQNRTFLQPTEFGLKVDGLVHAVFPALVSEDYTAEMEASLDRIEHGELGRIEYLRAWHGTFRDAMADAADAGERYRAEHGLRPHLSKGGEETNVRCDRCGARNYLKIARKTGKGSFLSCPDCGMTRNVRAKTRPGACKKCGSTLIERTANSGTKFFGCVRYGAEQNPCDYTEREDGSVGGRYQAEPYHKDCPKCLKHKLLALTPRNSGDGEPFYICSDRACTFKPLPVGSRVRKAPCPECGHAVLERRRRPTPEQQRNGTPPKSFWSCARYPECRYAQDMADA